MRPNMLKLIGNQEEEKAKVNNSLNGMTFKGFKQDDSTKFLDINDYRNYINPEAKDALGFDFTSNYDKDRAINQSNWEQAGRTLTKILPNTVLEFVSQVGNVLDFEDYANSDNEVGNWLSIWANELKAKDTTFGLDTRVFRENPNEPLDIGDAAWWMESGSNLVESASAFVGLGYLTGGASLRLLNNGGKALEWLKVIGKGASASDKAQKGIRITSGLTNALALNQAEGVGIAADVYQQVYAKELDRLKKENENLSDEELDKQAKSLAANKAASVVNFNRSNILLNLTSSFAFLRTPTLTRQLRKAPSTKKTFNKLGFEGLQESAEETINLIAEKQALDDNYSFDKALKDVATKEGAESAILGFVGGAGQTALTNAGRTIKLRQDNEGNRFSRNDTQQSQFEQQQQSKAKIEAISKAEKLSDVTDAYLKANETYELYKELESATTNGDFTRVQEISDMLIGAQAYDAFTNGTTEQYINVFKGIKALDPDIAEDRGLDKKTYKQDSDRAIKRIENLETEFLKANTYVNFNEVYDNRARALGLRDSKEGLEKTLETKRTEVLQDLSDLGIKDDVISFSETGGISLINWNKYGKPKKANVNNLQSLKEYKELKDEITKTVGTVKRLAERYTKLTSDEEQTRIANLIKEAKRLKKEAQSEAKVQAKQKERAAKANEVSKKFERETETIIEEDTVEENTVEDVNNLTEETEIPIIDDNIGFTFEFAENIQDEAEKFNVLINDANIKNSTKITNLKNVIANLKKGDDFEGKAGMLVQFENAIRYLTELEENTVIDKTETNAATKKATDDTINALEDLDPISEDNEELDEDEKKLIKQKRLVQIALNSMKEAGLDITDFPTVAEFTQKAVGRAKFVRIFDEFKALYNLTGVGESTNLTYEDIFFSDATKRNIVSNKASIDATKAFNDLYAMSGFSFKNNEQKTLINFIEQQGYKVSDKSQILSAATKIVEGYNKLAHLDKKYTELLTVNATGVFNVLDFITSKSDLDKELNANTSQIALDYDKFGEGDTIKLIVLPKVVYDDGSIAYADGRIENNGEVTQNDPIETAPIAVVFNGEILKGHYLHTPEWINENTIANFKDVERQRKNMRIIRKAILASPNGITTTIKDRSNGHFMRDVNGIYDTVSKNLPNVTMAIGKDSSLFTGENTIITTENEQIFNGSMYAVMDVNKGAKFGVPVERDLLNKHPKYINSILQAVRLYLNANPNAKRAIKLRELTNIDITTVTGLRTYLEKFIFLNPKLDNNSFIFDKFKTHVKYNTREDVSVIRLLTDSTNSKKGNLEFGRGANVGDTTRFINRELINKIGKKEGNDKRNALIDALLGKLKNVLNNNTYMSFVRGNFDTEFQLPIITDTTVTVSEMPYDTFVKDHTTTDLYSYTLDDGKGKEIYTVQPNLEFDVTFAFAPKVAKEVVDAPILSEIEVIDEIEELGGFDVLEDMDDDTTDFDPKTTTEEEQEEFENTILDSLFVKGISINLQDTIINHLTSQVLKSLYVTKSQEDALRVIDDFANTEIIQRINKLQTALTKKITDEQKKRITRNLEIALSVQKEYPKIVKMVLDTLHQQHGILKNGKIFESIKTKLDEDEIGFDDFEDLIDENGELSDYNNWESDGAFRTDFKRQLSQEVKNFFSYIEDIKDIKDGVIIPNTSWGLNITVPFDQVMNELSAILAYSNYKEVGKNVTIPTFKSMITTLEEWTETKPYIHNVIKALNDAPQDMKNKFISVMSKSYTHHIYIFKNKKGELFINTSDNNDIVGIIQKQWLNNIYASNLVKVIEEDYFINEEEVIDVNKNVKEVITLLKTPNIDGKIVIDSATALLTKMGFTFPKKLVTTLINEGVVYSAKRFSLLTLLTANDGAFKIYIDKLNQIKGLKIDENNPLANNSALGKFTRQIGKLHPVYFTNAFKDVRGRTYYGYTLNKFITDRTRTLKTDNVLLEKLSKQPFSKSSYWVRQFLHNPKFKEHFGYYTFDGRTKEGAKGKKLEHMSPAEIEEVKIGLFYKQYKKGNTNIINLLYPTTSDKSVSYGLTVLGHNWNGTFTPEGKIGNKRLDWLYDAIVTPEINRILSIQDNTDSWDINAYAEGGMMFNIVPSLNNLTELWEQDGNVKKLKADITENGELRGSIQEELRIFLNDLINNKLNTWREYGFIKEEETEFLDEATNTFRVYKKELLKYRTDSNDEITAHSSATNFVLNYLVANVNIFQTFTTDPAFYWKSEHWKTVAQEMFDNEVITEPLTSRKETLQYYNKKDWLQEHEDLFDNMGKRLGADSAPGIDIPNSPNETFTYGIIADTTKPSYLLDYYKGLLGNKATKYSKVNNTDAQEFTTLEEHLNILTLKGTITKQEGTDLLFKDNNNIELSNEDLKIILQPMKPVYVNNIWRDGIEHRLYVKSSSFPLFKQLTKGLPLDKLRKQMLKENIQRIAFESAVKIGGTKFPKEMLAKGKISVLRGIPREGFKIQQELPYKDIVDFINDGTQQRKLLTAAVRRLKAFKIKKNSDELVTGQRIQDILDRKYDELYKIKYTKLIEELDYDVNEGTINMKNLQEILVNEALSRKYPLYDLEALKLADNEFIIPLWLTGVSGKFEAMLNSIVDNRVRKLKPKGKSYILGTAAGFEIIEGNEATTFMKTTKGIIYDKEWHSRDNKELLSMRIEDANGVLRGAEGFDESTAKVKPAEVLAPFRFKDDNGNILYIKDFMTEDGLIDSTKLPSNLLELFGFRIPTHLLNSMAHIKIVGFLPKTSGDLIIAPPDWTVQMGSDFDIDKLFTNSYNTSFKDGKLTKHNTDNRVKQIEDDILDLHFSILSSTDARVQALIMEPLGFGKLFEVIEEIYPSIDNIAKGIGASEEYQSYKYRNARAAKAGIGVFSTDDTFLASMQGKNINLTVPVKDGVAPYIFQLGNVYNNDLSELDTNNKNNSRTKFEIVTALQALSVDNENEQGMHKLNINKHTFSVIRTLALSGFEEDIIFYFINQPIIREYIKLKTKAEDTATTYQTEQIEIDLFKQYPLSDQAGSMPSNVFMNAYANPSKVTLLNGIKNKEEIIDDIQRALYLRFIELNKYGKKLQTIQSAINSDSAGLGKDLFYSSAKEDQITALEHNNYIQGVHSLIGDYLTLKNGQGDLFNYEDNHKFGNVSTEVITMIAEWYNGTLDNNRKKVIIEAIQKEGFIPTKAFSVNKEINDTIGFIRPTTINGFASVYGLLFNNQIWGRKGFFPYNLSSIKNVTESIKNVTGNRGETIQQQADINRNVFSGIKSFLATKFTDTYVDGELLEERDRLFVDTKDNKSLATIIDTLRKTNKLRNSFINRLNLDLKKTLLPNNITYNAASAENINERAIYASVSKMLTDDITQLGEFNKVQYTPKKIMQDLIAHQLISGGVQKATQFIKYIPINYLKAVGYYDSIKNLNLLNENQFSIRSYRLQFIQHNPKEVELANIENLKLNYKYYNNNTVIIQKNKEAISLPAMFSVPNIKAVSGYSLYLKDPQSKQWRQIDTLGYNNILEYDANRTLGKSIIPYNQTPEVTNPTLPETVDEINTALTIRKESSEDSEVIFTPNDVSITDYFNLNSNDTSLNKFNYILNQIINNSDNKYHSFLAQELNNNLEKIKDYAFIIDTSLQARGSFNLSDKTIKVNPNLFLDTQDFEKTILEELIHAYTKEALIKNKTGTVIRLKALRVQAEKLVRESLGESADIKFNTLERKLKEGTALNDMEYNLLYPVRNDVEFVGRLFKSKQLQELLNNIPSDVEGKSILNKLWDIITELLNSIGIDIKKGSALEYATIDIISLINQPPPSSSIKGELQKVTKVIRTPNFIYNYFNMYEEDGSFKIESNKSANDIANWVNENVTNLKAIVKKYDTINSNMTGEDYYVDIIDISEGTQLGLDLDPNTETNKAAILLVSINNRIQLLEANIEKAEKREDFKKVEELTDILQNLTNRRDGLNAKGEEDDRIISIMQIQRLAEAAVKGEQDMQEIAEMLNRKVTLEDTLYIRKVIHFWKTAKKTLFDEDDLQSEVLVNRFSEIANEAERHENTLVVLENKYMESLMKKYGNNLTVENLFNHFKDINGLQRDFLDISRSNNPMLDSVFLSVKDANIDALDETRKILSELNNLESKIRPLLKSLGHTELYDIFRQRTEKGKLTGHLVNRYSTKFDKGQRTVKNMLKDNKTFSNYNTVLEWARKNTAQIELQYLFPVSSFTKEEQIKADDYIEKFKESLGETHFNEFMTTQAKLLENYENFKQGRLELIADKFNIEIEQIAEDSQANKEFINWKLVNSPYAYYSHMKTKKYGRVVKFRNFNSPNFIHHIPKDRDNFDKNFRTIETNPELLEFYNYYTKVDKQLKTVMPTQARTQLAFDGIPYIEKVLFDEYRDKGMKIGLIPILDGMKKSSRTDIEGNISNTFIDPVTEIEEKRLGINLSKNNSEEYFAYIKTKTIEYKLKTGNNATPALLELWSEEITDKLAQQKSYDLPKVLRVYALTVLAYKHKARIEDGIKLAQNILGKQTEFKRNSKGQILQTSQNRVEPKSTSTSFINTKKQFDYFVQVFYGKTKQNEGVTDKIIYTKEEKIRVTNYKNILKEVTQQFKEDKISKTEYELHINTLQEQIDAIGGVAVWSKRGDGVLKYVQLKSMGWNMMSAIANIGFGFISNKIEAAGGALYTSSQLSKAYRLVWDSLMKNWTFNRYETTNAKKIRSLMDKWDVLKDATHELFQNPLNIELSKNKKWLAPYNLTQRTEYLNQAPLMIALMMNTKIKTDKGNINMWEAYDNNGVWKKEYGEEDNKLTKKLRNKLDQLNKMNHGNYDGNSPLRVKDKFKGRALSQFRTWMFEGLAARVEKEKPDILLGTRKGRYRSLIDYFNIVGIKKGTLDSIKGLIRNVTLGKLFTESNFEEDIDGENLKLIDAQNMRKVMMEVVLVSGIYGSYLMLKLMAGNLDDEEDAKKKYAINLLINQGIRLKTDILFYVHPGELKNLMRDLVPAAGLVKDLLEWGEAVRRFTIGEDEISTGVYSGHSRLLRETIQALPFGTQVYKNINYSIQTFDK